MQGKPYEIADLMRVSVYAAHHVMVLGLSRRPREADSQVITMLCALRCLPISMSPQCLVVAELRQSQAKSVARQLFVSNGEEESAEVLPVAAAQAVDALLVLCTVAPLAGRALMGLMSFAGDQLEIVRAADSGGALVGRSFGEARRCFPKGVLIGLIRSEAHLTHHDANDHDHDEQLNETALETGVAAKDSVYRDRERVRLAPPDDELILASDSLVVLAEDQADAAEGLHGVAQAARRSSTIPAARFPSISLASMGKIAITMSNLSPSNMAKAAFSKDDPDATPPATPTPAPAPSAATACAAAAAPAASASTASACAAAFVSASTSSTSTASIFAAAASAASASAASASAASASAPAPAPKCPHNFSDTPVTILIIGWSTSLPSLLQAFDMRLARGSQAFILGSPSMAKRAEDLAADGLDLEGNAWAPSPPTPGGQSPPSPGGASPGGAAAETSSGLRNVRLNHVVGFETDYLALRRLPVRRADLALIIADAVQPPGLVMSGWSEPQMNDSGAMTSSILLRRLRDEVTAGLEGADRPPPLQVVTQLADVLTYRLLRKTPGLLNTRASVDSNCADTLDFHRNYMETTTVSVAANNSDAWSALRTLIYPAGGSELAAIPVVDAVPADKLLPTPVAAAACAEEDGLSFWEIGERVRRLGLGVLVGWHRVPRPSAVPEDLVRRGSLSSMTFQGTLRSFYSTHVAAPKHTLFVNPVDKDMPLTWCRHDRLLVVRKG